MNLTHNTFYITYCRITSKYFFNCFNSDQSTSILLTPNKGFIPEWNYEYEGRTEIVCDPLLPLSQLGEGGTFMLQSPKGNGKTESIRTFLNSDELKNKSVLIISYRVSLCNKYAEELEECGFSLYNDISNEEYLNLNQYSRYQLISEFLTHQSNIHLNMNYLGTKQQQLL